MALHFLYYNFVRVHKTLRTSPAMRHEASVGNEGRGDDARGVGSSGGALATSDYVVYSANHKCIGVIYIEPQRRIKLLLILQSNIQRIAGTY